MSDHTLFRNFNLITMKPGGSPYGLLTDAAVLVRSDRIVGIGSADELLRTAPEALVVEGDRRFLSPGLIDCHTHLVYGGNRADEWERRLNGVPYEQIAAQGGGILSTVRSTRAATEAELLASATRRLQHLQRQGVTSVEIKSGYGLDQETELKMLRVARQLSNRLPVRVSPTLLAAHALPQEFSGRADEYIAVVCEEMIPAATELCDSVDAFCESIAFDVRQTRRVLQCGIDHGLHARVHAEQLSHTGAAAMAAQLGAISVDHLEYLSEEDCAVLGRSGTVATLLPGAFYNLRESRLPPVDGLRREGVPIAIATDSNPGSSPVSSILLMAHMACTLFGLTPEEATAGLTRNAARALGMEDQLGTIEPGKLADLAVWEIGSPAELAYGIGHNPCVAVYSSGRPVFDISSTHG